MDYRRYIILSSLLALTIGVRAQYDEDKGKALMLDSASSDFQEWLRNKPITPEMRDSLALTPLPPSMPTVDPMRLKPKQPPVSINIMTPKLRTEMQLAYQSHWLEEQRKSQVGGAMTIGVNPISLIGYLIHKILPKRKSKKQRQREQLQQILDNY